MRRQHSRQTRLSATGCLVGMAFMLSSLAAGAEWWDQSWHFKSPVEVEVGAAGFTAEYQANFSLLAEVAGQAGAFDENSVRVVSAGNEIPFVFVKSYGYDAAASAVGRLKWVVEPAQAGETKRRYDVYFDLVENGPKPARAYPDLEKASKPRVNLFPNSGFDVRADGEAQGWQRYGAGYEFDGRVGRASAPSVRCENRSAKDHRGVACPLELNHRTPRPVLVSGWSKAENVSGRRDRNYSIYVDITYDDGSKLWAQTAEFSTGTHDWERSERWIQPKKPIKTLRTHALFRGHTGVVWFDDLSIEVLEPEDPPALATVECLGERGRAAPPLYSLSAADGLKLGLVRGSGRVGQVAVGGRDATHAPSSVFSGFFVRDVANRSDFVPLRGELRAQDGRMRQTSNLPGLGIELQATYEAKDTHVEVAGEVVDTSGKDRAVTLEYRLPIDAVGWQWGENVLSARAIETNAVCSNTLYPFSTIDNGEAGIALGIPMDMPCVFGLDYDSRGALRTSLLRFDFGLTQDTAKFPGRARFRFVVFAFSVPKVGQRSAHTAWGFRSALKKWYTIFPEFFVKRVEHEGIWLWGAGDLSKRIPDLDDFGFGFDEGPMCPVKFDNEHGIHTFANTCQPMQHWAYLGEYDEEPDLSPQQAAAIAQAAAEKNPKRAEAYRILVNAGIHDKDGHYLGGYIHNDVWEAFGGTGRRWSMPMWVNGDPELPRPNMALSKMDMFRRRQPRPVATHGRIDGAYIDNVFWTLLSNYRRDHFKHSDLPLTFDRRTLQVVQPVSWGLFELVKFVADQLHSEGKLTMGNIVVRAYNFMGPLFDVGGQEMSWRGGDQFADFGGMGLIRSLAHRRAFMYQKPIPMLVSGSIYPFPKEAMEHYMKLCMFWGVFPGTDYAAPKKEGGRWAYWLEPSAYERDRPLFKRYVPIIRSIAAAGWEPLTHAWVEPPSAEVWIERFGYWPKGNLHFTVRNEGETEAAVRLVIDGRALSVPADQAAGVLARELVSGKSMAASAKPEAGALALPLRISRKDTIVVSLRSTAQQR